MPSDTDQNKLKKEKECRNIWENTFLQIFMCSDVCILFKES